uniref:Uncharacterized protein n=1 Tax=Glossina brevipalpis TaxID=37001 RepID=A0A1A9W9V3_9MUSC
MNTAEKADVHSVDETKQKPLNAPEEHKQSGRTRERKRDGDLTFFTVYSTVPRLRRFWLRLCRQQPMTKTFNNTILTPDATPTNSKVPEVPPNGVALVVGGPPREEAGCEGGGASIRNNFNGGISDFVPVIAMLMAIVVLALEATNYTEPIKCR